MSPLINARHYSVNQSVQADLEYAPDKNYLFALDYLTCIQVTGDKASEFLQGQLSCDMRAISETAMRHAVMCDLKGRVLAALDVLLRPNTGYLLVSPEDLAASIRATLSKPAMFSRTQLHSSTLQVYGFYLQNENDRIPFESPLPTETNQMLCSEQYSCYQITPSFFVWVVDSAVAHEMIAPFRLAQQYRGAFAWHALQLQARRFEIYPETQGLFLPHRLDMHNTGYLNFEKGCYKGQEIIARMHYRATLKHALVSTVLETQRPLRSGMALLGDDHETVIGEVIDYTPQDNHHYLVVASIVKDYTGAIHVQV